MELEKMYCDLGISKEVLEYGARIEAALEDRFTEIDGNAEYNQLKVIAAMQKNRVSDIHFSGTTGYGYNDLGVLHDRGTPRGISVDCRQTCQCRLYFSKSLYAAS